MNRGLSYILIGAGLLVLAWKREAIVTAVVETVAGWKLTPNADKYLPLLNATEVKYGIPRDLLARVAYQESRFRDDIVTGKLKSSAGAVGIMQIVPRFHPNVDPLNVPAAVDYAAKFLSGLKATFGNWQLAVAAYNAGAGNVRKFGGIPPFEETQKYVAQVFKDVPVTYA
jgi:soluble lytic murein transglycosylase-like protein